MFDDEDWNNVPHFSAPGNFGDGHKIGIIQSFETSADGTPIDNTDYRQFYELEQYLFETVHQRFHRQGWISTFDFFCIMIWKSNRSKTKIVEKLEKLSGPDLDLAVYRLTSTVYEAQTNGRKLSVLVEDWKIPVATASAILTVFYPDEFTVYDVRACNSLNAFHSLKNKTSFPRIWEEYSRFIDSVKSSTPEGLSLRDKDRFLWGKSFFEDLKKDVYSGFSKE